MLNRAENDKAARLKDEMCRLSGEIGPGQYKKYTHPFPDFLPEPGSYSNNIAFVARFELNEPTPIDGEVLHGPVYEYCFIRDDRELRNDPSTKHINVHYRILGTSNSGDLMQGSYKKADHFISPVAATSMAYIEENRNLKGLSDTGPISHLIDRGVLLDLGHLRTNNFGANDEAKI